MKTPAAKSPKLHALGYTRTSSSTNVGADKDSETRQRLAIQKYADANNTEVIGWFNDPAVSGADPVETRPGFAALLARIAGKGVRTVIVETSSRFARDLMVQEIGFAKLRELGVTLIAADSPTAFLDDGPTSKLIRQILGVVTEFEKTMLVAKLKGARDRKKALTGKCGGRKNHAELSPGVVAAARKVHASSPKPTLRHTAMVLAEMGILNVNGRPYAAASIRSMLKGA